MLKRNGYVAPDKWLYPIDPSVDYRLPENRMYLLKSWVECLSYTTEHNQQLRLMNWCIDEGFVLTPDILETKLWLAFLWGCCYNLTGPWVILNRFATPPKTPQELKDFADWYNLNFERIRFDTDCRYRKSKMIACVTSYAEWLGDDNQEQAFAKFWSIEDPKEKFEKIWESVSSISFYGRLSTWNQLEALELVTGWKYGVDCQTFMLEDATGSESNRNGVCFLLGREDLLTKHGKTLLDGRKLTDEEYEYLENEAEVAFTECVEEFNHITKINRLNFETSGLCWFKKKFRLKNTRYLGWDSERTLEEMLFVEGNWSEVSIEPLYQARKYFLPEFMLSECNGTEMGVQKWKMPLFKETGTPWDIVKFQSMEIWKQKIATTQKLW